MESALLSYSLVLIALSVIVFVGGSLAFLWDKTVFASRRDAVWATFHQPWWDKEGVIQPKHKDCLECEVEVDKVGGLIPSHSTME